MNSSPEEEEEESTGTEDTSSKSGSKDEEEEYDEEEEEVVVVVDLDESHSDSDPDTAVARVTAAADDERRPLMYTPARNQAAAYECGEDALMTESEQTFLRSFVSSQSSATAPIAAPSSSTSSSYLVDLSSTSPPAGLAAMPVYASNLDQALLSLQGGVLDGDVSGGGGGSTVVEQFYPQPEPTLLTIAAGTVPHVIKDS